MDLSTFTAIGEQAADFVSKWQNLIASIIAIWAGLLAYRGAVMQRRPRRQLKPHSRDGVMHSRERSVSRR